MFESVVKALFDIKSDFVNIEVYMGCDAIVVVDTDKIRIVLLYQSVFHLGVIGATYLTDDFLAPCPNFFSTPYHAHEPLSHTVCCHLAFCLSHELLV